MDTFKYKKKRYELVELLQDIPEQVLIKAQLSVSSIEIKKKSLSSYLTICTGQVGRILSL